MDAGKERHVGKEGAVSGHRLRHFQIVGAPDFEIFDTVTRRRMHQSRALLDGYVLARKERHIEVVPAPAQWMARNCAAQRRALEGAQNLPLRDARIFCGGFDQRRRNHQTFAWHRATFFARRSDLDQRVIDLRPIGDGAISRNGPRRRRPDHHVSCIGLPALDLYVAEYLYDRLGCVERLPTPALRRAG